MDSNDCAGSCGRLSGGGVEVDTDQLTSITVNINYHMWSIPLGRSRAKGKWGSTTLPTLSLPPPASCTGDSRPIGHRLDKVAIHAIRASFISLVLFDSLTARVHHLRLHLIPPSIPLGFNIGQKSNPMKCTWGGRRGFPPGGAARWR